MELASKQPNPEVNRVAQRPREAADSFEHGSNLPAIVGGSPSTEILQSVLQQLVVLDDRLNRMDRRIQDLDRWMIVAERNRVARMENSTALRLEATLTPLFSFESGTEIAGCPSTVEEAGTLAPHKVDRILRLLGVSTAGRASDRRRHLLFALGVPTRAI